MQRQPYSLAGALSIIFILQGCAWPVWPVMPEGNGYQPVEMGKDDQVFYWNAPRPTVLSKDFTRSHRAIRKDQTLNADAPADLETAKGQDGQAAVYNAAQYRKFWQKPPFVQVGSGGSKK